MKPFDARNKDEIGTGVNPSPRHLEATELDQLYQFIKRNGTKYFAKDEQDDGIKFKSYVGVIQVGQLTLEVLPKSDRSKGTEEDYGRWQKALLDMLRLCHKTSIDSTSETRLRKRHNSILDLYFEMYINEVDKLLRMGLVKRYRRVQKTPPASKANCCLPNTSGTTLSTKNDFLRSIRSTTGKTSSIKSFSRDLTS